MLQNENPLGAQAEGIQTDVDKRFWENLSALRITRSAPLGAGLGNADGREAYRCRGSFLPLDG
jgi:hypothetical protein